MKSQHISDFAETVDPPTTVRNLRYLISEGILPEPEHRHRTLFFGERHAAAYAIYADLSARGFSAKLIASFLSTPDADIESAMAAIRSLRKLNTTKETV